MEHFAVIDTETNWDNAVMSIGVAVAEPGRFRPLATLYYILTPECRVGGMYDSVLDLVEAGDTRVGTRRQVMGDLCRRLSELGVERIFAYNARFDKGHLPELSHLDWYDIMRIAAYRQHNPAIPEDALCCSTGRLKRCYGVEPMLRLLSCDPGYRETHNALYDAVDELKIMELLNLPLEGYACARI